MPKSIGKTYITEWGISVPVILKSHALKAFVERDGMTPEEADEYWEYNYIYSGKEVIAVDDITLEEFEILNKGGN